MDVSRQTRHHRRREDVARIVTLPERALLTCCSPARRDLAASYDGLVPESPAQWRALVDLALAGGVLPLLADVFYREDLPLQPDPQMAEQVRMLHAGALAWEISLDQELATALSILGEADIPVIVVKGLALREQAYRGSGLRHMADVDLLLPPQDKARGEELVRSLAKLTSVDFHAALHVAPWFLPCVERDTDGWWQRSVELQGRPGVRALAPEDHLLWICYHSLHGGWGSLMHLCDVAWLIHQTGDRFNWDQLLQAAQQARMAAVLYPMLRLAESLLGTRLPAGFAAVTRPPALRGWLVDRLTGRRLVRGGRGTDPYRRWLAICLLADGPGDAARTVWRMLFPHGTHVARKEHGTGYVPPSMQLRASTGARLAWAGRNAAALGLGGAQAVWVALTPRDLQGIA
jgi:hypothetical protein